VQLSLPSFQAFSQLFAANPSLVAMQLCMVAVGVLLVYLVLYATRDILLRTHSFFYQIAVIILVAVLPVVGFLLYLLIRPSMTNRQRKLERDVHDLLKRFPAPHAQKKHQPHQHNHKHHSKPKPQGQA
jgi:ABC-type nickel/cobalt efflux system permease component RcnA